MKKGLKIFLFLFIPVLCFFNCEKNEEKPVEGEITSFSVTDQKNVTYTLSINKGNNVISNKTPLPAYVDLSQLLPEFTTNHKNVVLKINGEVQKSGISKADFSSERVYELYYSETKQKTYKVRLTKAVLTNNFKDFWFAEPQMSLYQPELNVETGEITSIEKIPLILDITELKPMFSTEEKSAVVKVDGMTQTSGKSIQNFSKPVVYTIHGEDGSTKTFTVTLEKNNEANVVNPIMKGSYADPTVIRVDKTFYMYVTSGRVRGYKSTNLINWSSINSSKLSSGNSSASEVFTVRPHITEDDPNDTGLGMWAPDINYFDGQYVMYYSISKWGGGATCGIGVAVSTKPGGPFVAPATGNSSGRLFVSSEIGVNNSIDPCFVEDNGKRYLFWGSFTGLFMTELSADGMTVKDVTKKTQVAGNSFEATYIHKRGNYYYLFASVGTCCEGLTASTYKVVVGRSTKLEGPYVSKSGADMKTFNTKYSWPTNYQPIVLKGDGVTFGGPGHNARIITDDNGVDWMLYHAYVNNGSTERNLALDKVTWSADNWPMVGNGTPSYILKEIPVFN